MTAIDGLLAAIEADPHRPRLTFFTADGMRTELSGVPLLNWAAKVAGLLLDELGGAPGDQVFVRSGTGWQTAGILLGTWWAGLTVTDIDSPGALAAFVADGADPAEGVADEVFVVSGHPLGAPSRQVAAHQRDFSGAVLGQADRFRPRFAVDPSAPALIGDRSYSLAELRAASADSGHGLRPGDRLLTTGQWTPSGELIRRFLGPVAAGAGVVHALDLAEAEPAVVAGRAASEGATHTLGLAVPELPRLD